MALKITNTPILSSIRDKYRLNIGVTQGTEEDYESSFIELIFDNNETGLKDMEEVIILLIQIFQNPELLTTSEEAIVNFSNFEKWFTGKHKWPSNTEGELYNPNNWRLVFFDNEGKTYTSHVEIN